MNTISIDTPEARFRRCLPASIRDADENKPISEIGIDSIDAVDFFCAIHGEFGVRLKESDFNPEQTLRGLFTAIRER